MTAVALDDVVARVTVLLLLLGVTLAVAFVITAVLASVVVDRAVVARDVGGGTQVLHANGQHLIK